MKLFNTKVWNWNDVWMLKWSAFLFGIVVGSYFCGKIGNYAEGILLVVAVLLAIRPTLHYFRD